MKRTLYYYQLNGSDEVDKFKGIITKERFSEEKGCGFSVDIDEPLEFRFCFAKKEEITEEVFTPSGERYENKRVIVKFVRGRLLYENSLLEIYDQGRYCHLMFDFILQVSHLDLRPLRLLPHFGDLFAFVESQRGKVDVLAMKTDQFLIRGRTQSRVEFQSLVDVKSDVDYFLGKRDYNPSYVKLSFSRSRGNTVVEILRSGRMVVNFDQTDQYHATTLKDIFQFMTAAQAL